jgi:hypothetical protein
MNDDGAPFVTKRYTPVTSSNQVRDGVKSPPNVALSPTEDDRPKPSFRTLK